MKGKLHGRILVNDGIEPELIS